jgi:hypothetical protein
MFWMILFSAAIYSADPAFQAQIAAGPFPELKVCAALGALMVSSLNQEHPDKDYRVECAPDHELKRHTGRRLYNLQQLLDVVETD